MNVAIIDCRSSDQRAADLGSFLYHWNHNVTKFDHVNFQEQIGMDWNEVKSAVIGLAHEFDPIILHVGPDQMLAEEALANGFAENNVICFTGAHIPDYCKVDCRKKPKHCYIPAGSIPSGNTWPELWKKRILEYIRLLEQGKPEDARNLIMEYDPDLEVVLDTLTKEFSGFLDKHDTPTDAQLKDFATNERDVEFRKWAEKKAARQ